MDPSGKETGSEPTAYSRIRGSLFVSGKLVLLSFTVSFLTLVSILTGKPDDRVVHVDLRMYTNMI